MATIVVCQFVKMTAKQRVAIVQWTISMAGAILTFECLRWIGVAGQIDNQLMAIGFDVERVLLIEQLLLVFLGSMLAGLLFQRNSSLYAFKAKFHPHWESRYLLVSEKQAAPRILLALVQVHSGGWSSMLKESCCRIVSHIKLVVSSL